MTLSEYDRKQLIKYRIEQAEETIEEVDLLLENNKLRAALSRIYYGIFYAVLALALKYDFKTSRHQKLIGWFNREFIHSGIIDLEYGKILRKAYQYRTEGDYEAIHNYTHKEVVELFDDMQKFIARVKTYLNK